MVLGLVGPCTSGKSTIRKLLEARGFRIRHIAQEHSHVPDMWKVVANPDRLVFLEVSYREVLKRRRTTMTIRDYEEQQRRLSNARANADLIVETDGLSPQEIAEIIRQKFG